MTKEKLSFKRNQEDFYKVEVCMKVQYINRRSIISMYIASLTFIGLCKLTVSVKKIEIY